MRIEVDRERCEGLGMCEAMASDVFEIDDDEVARARLCASFCASPDVLVPTVCNFSAELTTYCAQ